MYLALSILYMALAALTFHTHAASYGSPALLVYMAGVVFFFFGITVLLSSRLKIALEFLHYLAVGVCLVLIGIGAVFETHWMNQLALGWQDWQLYGQLGPLVLDLSPLICLPLSLLIIRKSQHSEESFSFPKLIVSLFLFALLVIFYKPSDPQPAKPIAVQTLEFSPDRAFVRIALSDHPDRSAVYSLKNGKRDIDPAPIQWYGGPIALPTVTRTYHWGRVTQSTGKVQLDPYQLETITLLNATDFDALAWTVSSPEAKMVARLVEGKVEFFDSHVGKWLFTLQDANLERGSLMNFSEDGSLFIYPIATNRFRVVKVPSFTSSGVIMMEGELSSVYISSRANAIFFTKRNENASHTLTSFSLDSFAKTCSTNLPGKDISFSGDPIHAVVGSFPRVVLANLVDCQILKTFAHIDNAALSMDGRKLTLIGEKGEFSTMDAYTGEPLWYSQETVKIRGFVNIFGMPNDALMAISTNKNVLVVNPRGKKVAEFIVD